MKQKTYKSFTIILFIISLLFFLIGVTSPLLVKIFLDDPKVIVELARLGPVGDWLGGAAAPFINSASFIILLVAYLAQKEELNLTRNEMRNQNLTLIQQRFDNTFFNLLHLHQQIISSLKHSEEDYSGKAHTYTARGLINKIHGNFEHELKKRDKTSKELNMYDEISHIFYRTHEFLDQIFQSLLSITEFISSSPNEIPKETYWKIFKAQISNQESCLLFFYLAYWNRDERVTIAINEDKYFIDYFNSVTFFSSEYRTILLKKISGANQ